MGEKTAADRQRDYRGRVQAASKAAAAALESVQAIVKLHERRLRDLEDAMERIVQGPPARVASSPSGSTPVDRVREQVAHLSGRGPLKPVPAPPVFGEAAALGYDAGSGSEEPA